MDVQTLISLSGLLISTLGVVLIFFFGISPFLKSHEEGAIMLYDDDTINDQHSKMNKKRRLFRSLAYWGLYLSIAGGVLQSLPLFINLFFN